MQVTLSSDQLQAFYHDEFVEDQVRHFLALVGQEASRNKVVKDVGGGCGLFARRLSQVTASKVRVLDTDPAAIETCRQAGVEAQLGDAAAPPVAGDEDIVTFNLILHHLVGHSERITYQLQGTALRAWRDEVDAVFVNEYIYESFIPNLSGWLIYQITKNQLLSRIGLFVSKFVPAFKANTFGVGVRFRSHGEWLALFRSAGFEVKSSIVGTDERVAPPLRLLLIKTIRRDSFLLTPRTAG